MSQDAELSRASFKPITGKGQKIDVHFNPVSLQYTVTNTLQEQGKDKKQYVSKSTAKLTMDLIFDTTHSGQDVRTYTEAIAKFMEPVKSKNSDKNGVPSVVEFDWGTYHFQGMVESYKETIDFFAPSGVPLRASVNLTLSRQDKVFDTGPAAKADAQSQEPVHLQLSPGETVTDFSTQGGDPGAGPALAAANNQDSMRFPSGSSLTVDPTVQLRGPMAFATGGAGIGIGAGAGIGIGGGAGAGIGGGISAGIGGGIGAGGIAGGLGGAVSGGIGISGGVSGGVAGAGIAGGFAGGGVSFGGGTSSGSAGFSAIGGGGAFAGGGIGFGAGAAVVSSGGGFVSTTGFSPAGVGFVGGSVSAGMPASSGAFAWLRTSSATQRTFSLDPDRFLQPAPSGTVATGSGAAFQVGGKATFDGSVGLSADVGATASLRSRISFEER